MNLPFANLRETSLGLQYEATAGDDINDVLLVMRLESARTGKAVLCDWNGTVLKVTPRMTLDQLAKLREKVVGITEEKPKGKYVGKPAVKIHATCYETDTVIVELHRWDVSNLNVCATPERVALIDFSPEDRERIGRNREILCQWLRGERR